VLAQYGVEIVHDINNNEFTTTTIPTFSATTIASTGITISYSYVFVPGSAERFIRSGTYTGNTMSVLSVHMMAAGQSYFKPFRLVNEISSSNLTGTTYSGTTSFTFTPSQLGLTSFTNGTYYCEFRFIGKRVVYPICDSFVVSTIIQPTPTPTPTPSPSPTGGTPTPTPTPSATPGGGLYTSGVTINVTDTGWLKYTSTTGDTYFQCTSLGTQVLPGCIICGSIRDGIPFADLASWTLVNCGTSCGGVSPTPTPSASAESFGHYVMTDCQTYQTRYSQSIAYGTYNSGDRVMGSYGYYYVITGFTPSTPDPSLIFFVSATGDFGCP
jgi:hypothetical protein